MEASMLLTVTVAALTTMQPPSTAMKPANADNNEAAQTTTPPPKIAYTVKHSWYLALSADIRARVQVGTRLRPSRNA